MAKFDALVAGGGPAGLLVGSVLARGGLRVLLADPNAGEAGPQGGHVHLLSDATWAGMRDLVPGLERSAVRHGAPMAPAGAAMLDGDLGTAHRAWPGRPQLDRALFDCVSTEAGLSVTRGRIGAVTRRDGLWRADGYCAEWIIDATGGSRATLRAVAGLAAVDLMEWGDRRGYASLVLEGIAWPNGRVGHGLRAEGGCGLVLRKTGRDTTLATLQLVRPDALPSGHAEFFDCIADVAPPQIAKWLHWGIPIEAVRRWTSRRSSAMLVDAAPEATGWMAVGDALLNSAPHHGQGLAQIVEQVRLISAALASGLGLAGGATHLQAWAEQRVIAATLSEKLAESCAAIAA